jgi:uncharacterized protein YbaR (Trm112 family)|tara:strand:+ start:249 stop:518 length:270 start_codon:yes stop_codon:yes gene_type:complete
MEQHMVDKELLSILACPQSQQPLKHASQEVLDRLNASISKGTLTNSKGSVVTEPLLEALVTKDGSILYPVRENIPVMLIDESISIAGVP